MRIKKQDVPMLIRALNNLRITGPLMTPEDSEAFNRLARCVNEQEGGEVVVTARPMGALVAGRK